VLGLLDGEKNLEDMCTGLDRIPACDRQTDRQTDASCGKNLTFNNMDT